MQTQPAVKYILEKRTTTSQIIKHHFFMNSYLDLKLLKSKSFKEQERYCQNQSLPSWWIWKRGNQDSDRSENL